MIRVLLAEDQAMFRTAVRRLLELEGCIRVPERVHALELRSLHG